MPSQKCPSCHSADTRRATVYWQCLTCGYEWQDAKPNPSAIIEPCATKGCNNQARIAIRTTRPKREDLRHLIYMDNRIAPKAASRYCKACGSVLAAELVGLADLDESMPEAIV